MRFYYCMFKLSVCVIISYYCLQSRMSAFIRKGHQKQNLCIQWCFLFTGTSAAASLCRSPHTHTYTHTHTIGYTYAKSCTRVLLCVHAHTCTLTERSRERLAGFESGCIPGYNGPARSHTYTQIPSLPKAEMQS